MDIFESKSAKPMLIAEMQEPFDSPDYIYELKLDGERCVAYLDKDSTTLLNKRDFILNPRFPELNDIHKFVRDRCILDGEVAILIAGKPDFSEVKRRSVLSNKFKVEMALNKHPASFTAFDILYYKDKQVTDMLLMERKKLLSEVVKENERLSVSRYIEGKGIALYEAAAKQDLEGVVAKRKGSTYQMGKRTRDWIKFKNLKDDDYIVLGYIENGNNTISVILGQYRGDTIAYKGNVLLGKSREDFKIISMIPKIENPFQTLQGSESAHWIVPELVCTVQFMELTSGGGLRQPLYKCLRDDKDPEDCIESKE